MQKRFILAICIGILCFPLYSQSLPVPSFTVNISSGCSPLNVHFTNSSWAKSCIWDFGDGNTSKMSNPSNIYYQPGTYDVKLLVYDSTGQQDSVIIKNFITVIADPSADFSADNTSGCSGDAFLFNDLSAKADSWMWDFGDGNVSPLQNPKHAYSSPGYYNVKLITRNTYGCKSIQAKDQYIYIAPKPVASFTMNSNFLCNAAQQAVFINTSSGASNFLWDFGDGNTSSLANPTHTYASAGEYGVRLIAKNIQGCMDSIFIKKCVTIYSTQQAGFSSDKQQGCIPFSIHFNDETPKATSWLWSFGDGTTSTQKNPKHTYQKTGKYTISLSVTNPGGCVYTITKKKHIEAINPPVPFFSSSTTSGCNPLQVSFTDMTSQAVRWLWEFGDDSTSSLQHPSHIYTVPGNYTVTLHAFNSSGCEVLYEAPISVSQIKSGFTASELNGCLPFTTTFSDKSTGAVQWLWDFGDGNISTQQNPVHTYTATGSFNVSLSVINAQGCKDAVTRNKYIQTINPGADFITPQPVSGCTPFTVSLSDATPGISWLWNFGDGNTSIQQNPVHTYNSAGTYTISLNVQASGSCAYHYKQFRIVKVETSQAKITYTQSPCPSYTALFDDTSSSSASWLWNFGDGSTSTLKSPSHKYIVGGTHPISLTTTSSQGCNSTVIQSLHFPACSGSGGGAGGGGGGLVGGGGSGGSNVQNNGNKEITHKGCIPLQVKFNNTLPNKISWSWNFGDGSTSNLKYPSHIYTNPGLYSITMIAKDSLGFSDTVIYKNYIKALRTKAHFALNANCNNQVSFSDFSSNASAWSWDFGDGNTSTLQHPSHQYANGPINAIVKLTCTSSEGCSDVFSSNIFSNNKIPSWAASYQSCTNTAIPFTTILSGYSSYHWDFGDGKFSSQQNPSHTYGKPGAYKVSLKAMNKKGCFYTDTLPKLVIIEDVIADFSYSGTEQCNSLTIKFSNLSSGITQPLSSACLWDFGDGSPVKWAENPIHTYAKPGSYQVSLTSSDGNCSSSIIKTVSVHPIAANFSFIQDNTCLPIKATFTDLSKNAASWLWTFGDGTTSSAQNPEHVFNSAPSTALSLTVADTNGCQATFTQHNIAIFKAEISLSEKKGCAPLHVSFTDKSLNAIAWRWDFGDGDTSSQQSPFHIYTGSGSYKVRLISYAQGGCSDTAFTDPVLVNKPTADFSSSLPVTCSPSLVSFFDKSSGNTTQRIWDFGDGGVSTNNNPAHIYNTPGIYSIKLIAIDNNGCKDTITKSNFIKIRGSIAKFRPLVDQGCPGVKVQFLDSSVNVVKWEWNFGDGGSSTLKNPIYVYQNPGSYAVSLIVADSTGCTSNIITPNSVIVQANPVVNFTASADSGCTPLGVNFSSISSQPSTFTWNFGNGQTSIHPNPFETYTHGGTYEVRMIATDQHGCSDTATDILVARMSPSAGFYSNTQEGCSSLNASFYDSSAQTTPNATYLWNFGNGTTSSQKHPSAFYSQPGKHAVALTVTNENGCSNTSTKTEYITVHDPTPPPASRILTATIVSDTSAYIVWEPSTAIDFSHYNVYRQNPSSGNFSLISNISNISAPSFSDVGLNALNNSYCYIIQTSDVCNSTLSMDSLTSHCTMNVTATGTEHFVDVNWTAYKGATINSYKIYRLEKGQSTPALIAQVPAQTLSITDTTTYCPQDYSYRVMAYKLNGNFISSNSDTAIARPEHSILAKQKVVIVKSTVVSDSCILTEWKAPDIGLEKVTGYTILRSKDNRKFITIAAVPAEASAYIDNNVNARDHRYFYKVEVTNSCNVKGTLSNAGTPILLRANYIDNLVVLEWTSYDGWDTEADYYVIEKQNDKGQWEVIRITDGNTLRYEE